ncbi:hypothetical protein FSE01_15255 [Salmonella enterica subsp. enterica]|nr:hypothetical protein [Salmonella enterica subsp. enterica serovar Veneziana]
MSRFPVETVSAPSSSLVDYSGYTTEGQSREIMPENASARLYRIQNLSQQFSVWINDTGGSAAAGMPGSYELAPGAYYEFSSPFAVSVFAHGTIPFSAARY